MDLLSDNINDRDSESDEPGKSQQKIVIDKKFAKKFEDEKRFNDLKRAKGISLSLDAEGNEISDDDSSESESEDEDADALSRPLELKVLLQFYIIFMLG